MKNYIILGALLLTFLLVGGHFLERSTMEDVQIVVTNTERIVESNGETTSSKYLVFSTTETFENTDAILFGKFNSSDLQGKLRIDSTYTVTVVGWRIPFLSSYRNIIEIK